MLWIIIIWLLFLTVYALAKLETDRIPELDDYFGVNLNNFIIDDSKREGSGYHADDTKCSVVFKDGPIAGAEMNFRPDEFYGLSTKSVQVMAIANNETGLFPPAIETDIDSPGKEVEVKMCKYNLRLMKPDDAVNHASYFTLAYEGYFERIVYTI